ncbi:hypothetical protein [Kordiimonas aquimaris]|uniref:hypothetical protein n=1 Tax=Kordiimonas aquimaris TaxID=707591 RepID=UPI0021CE8295|nr:hypothetical protein [Kordiimonas aquimaris]
MRNTIFIITCVFLSAVFGSVAGYTQEMNEDNWSLSEQGAGFVEHMGRKSLRLNNGFAVLNNGNFKDGIITFDISMPKERGFAGIYFRWNDNTAEHFYLRSHLSEKPDATQYTPRFNGLGGWQIYHGERYSVPSKYDLGSWASVKLVIKDNKMDVYINSDKPSLHVDNLMAPNVAGSIRFSGARQDFHISNFRAVADATVETIGEPKPRVPFPENLITSFNVGKTTVASADVEKEAILDSDLLAQQSWQTLEVDESGAANLARISGRTGDVNTLLVKLDISSDAERIIPIQYGFSDRVTVFLNGKAIAYGDDTYRSRDYRHLGTVGLYDSVFLPLKKGENQLVFAVTEAFGGWAIKAAMDPVSGVTVR